ncbi:MAG: apolipoprotein N-acyltransferase [Kiritimatiellae bacterium]|nr:apolipoprotein N-acyltransferase [Kiritimatiellia bacterium]
MIADALKKLARLFWLLPGFLLWASFPPMAEKTDCVFALAPLIWFARNRDSKANFRLWFLNGFVFWFATLSWMPAIVKNGGPWPLVVLGWGALAAYCALYFGAFGWLSSKVWTWVKDEGTAWRKPPRFPYARRLFAILVAEPLLWCGLELLRSRFLGGFSWNHLGLPLVNANLGSPAALGGVYLVSAVVILINGTIAGIAERIMKRTTRWASLETLIPFLLIWGLYALQGSAARRIETFNKEDCTVALVQRNFPCVFKRTEREDPIAVYSNLLANVTYTRPDLVVLAESALCEFGVADSPRSLAFARWVLEQTGAREVIAGGGRFADGKEYNSAILFSNLGVQSGRVGDAPLPVPHSHPSSDRLRGSLRSGDTFPVPQVYDKVHLVPFGEFIPGDKWITALQKLAPVGSCTPGELKLLGDYGVAICYEDTDSAQMRALLHKGARALVFITNDSWFSDSIEAEQHSWQAVARAVETGLPVIRVGNSGVTGTIDPHGRASWLSDADGRPLVDARGTMCDTVTKLSPPCPTMSPQTFYGTLGDIPLTVSFALLIVSMVLVKYRNTYEKRRYLSM